MRPGHRAHWGLSLRAGVLIATFLARSFLAGSIKSPVFDETGDIAAGLSYVQSPKIRANLQHPPLLRELAGAALWLGGVRLPETPQVRQMLADGGGERSVGSQLIAANGPDRTMFLARLPFLLLAAALGVLLYLWGRQLLGELPALAALFLYSLDPTILGHGYLATMDVGLAAFTVLFLFALWHYLEHPNALRLTACGAAMGLMLCTKFSAVFLLPVAAVLLAAIDRTKATRSSGRSALAFVVMGAVATLVIQAIYLSPGGLFLYSTGLQRVNADHNPDYLVFLDGQLEHHFATYFAAAHLLKEPIAALLLAATGLFALRGQAASRRVKLFLLLPPAVLFAAHTVFADILGVRYIIPVLPFAYLVGGAGVAWLIRQGTWGRAVTAALGVWLLVASVGIYPDHLSYFNEAACLLKNPGAVGLDGGTRCGPLWLDDSNVDWGQSLKQVKDWVDRNAKGQRVHLAYFGSFPPPAYGLNADPVGPDQLAQDPATGIYIVSAHFVARSPAAWLRSPTEIIGVAMYVYRVTKAASPMKSVVRAMQAVRLVTQSRETGKNTYPRASVCSSVPEYVFFTASHGRGSVTEPHLAHCIFRVSSNASSTSVICPASKLTGSTSPRVLAKIPREQPAGGLLIPS
jgi:Dolichyl-phosphate-mannose-protein mannosyltransferase